MTTHYIEANYHRQRTPPPSIHFSEHSPLCPSKGAARESPRGSSENLKWFNPFVQSQIITPWALELWNS
jgi:hypothetical protein